MGSYRLAGLRVPILSNEQGSINDVISIVISCLFHVTYFFDQFWLISELLLISIFWYILFNICFESVLSEFEFFISRFHLSNVRFPEVRSQVIPQIRRGAGACLLRPAFHSDLSLATCSSLADRSGVVRNFRGKPWENFKFLGKTMETS